MEKRANEQEIEWAHKLSHKRTYQMVGAYDIYTASTVSQQTGIGVMLYLTMKWMKLFWWKKASQSQPHCRFRLIYNSSYNLLQHLFTFPFSEIECDSCWHPGHAYSMHSQGGKNRFNESGSRWRSVQYILSLLLLSLIANKSSLPSWRMRLVK